MDPNLRIILSVLIGSNQFKDDYAYNYLYSFGKNIGQI